jgi:acetylornithine deacetylase
VAAVRAVEASGVALRRPVSIASVVGEEDGGLGTLATILRGHHADAAVIVEPTGSRLAIRQAGVLGFRIRVPGAPAHGAMRTRGVSAVEKAWPVFRALSELERVRNDRFDDPLFAGYEIPFALSIGIVQAGEWPSTVPDSLVAEGRYGVAPDEDPAAARREFEQAIVTASAGDAWLRVHPVEVSWPGGRFHPATTPDDATVVRSLAAVHTATQGTPAELTGAPYGSDLRHLVNTGGVPTVLYGPGSVHQAHVEDEYVPIEELEMVARTLAALVVRLCSDPGA